MVYIEQQSAYLSQFDDSQIASLLKEILKDRLGIVSEKIHIAGELALNLLIAVKSLDKSMAEKYYSVFIKRQPTKESHWIYDNYVLFSIVCAVRKFNIDNQWIRNVIDISYSGADSTNKKIKDSFKNLLSGNYNANGDFHQISVVYQFLAKDEHYNDKSINKMFHFLWLKPFPFFEEDFLNIISLKAIEIGFMKKSLLTDVQYYQLNIFVPNFNTRANFIAKIFSRVIIVTLIIAVLFLLWKLDNSEEQYATTLKIAVFLSSFSGVGVLAVWGWKSNLAIFFRTIIDRIFTYKSPIN
jgi:hypothetical protein